MNLGAPELAIIAGILVLIFGGAKLPQLARSLGEARREFEGASTTAALATPAATDATLTSVAPGAAPVAATDTRPL